MQADELFPDDDYDDRYFQASDHYDALAEIYRALFDARLDAQSLEHERIDAKVLRVRIDELDRMRIELEAEIERLAAAARAGRQVRLYGRVDCD